MPGLAARHEFENSQQEQTGMMPRRYVNDPKCVEAPAPGCSNFKSRLKARKPATSGSQAMTSNESAGSGRVGFVWLTLLCLMFGFGCRTPRHAAPIVSCRLSEATDGDSVCDVSINGSKFSHKSTSGGIGLYAADHKSVIRVAVVVGRGTFASSGFDHYYHVDTHGNVTYLGSLKSFWYQDEELVYGRLKGFKEIPMRECER